MLSPSSWPNLSSASSTIQMTTPSASPQGILAFGSEAYPPCWEGMACSAPSPIVLLKVIACRFQHLCPTAPRPDIRPEVLPRSVLRLFPLVPYLAPLLLDLLMKISMSCPPYLIRMKAMNSNQYKPLIWMMQSHDQPLTKDAGREASAKAKA